MNTLEIKQKLSEAPFFQNFDENELNAIISISKMLNISKSHIVFSELSPAKSLFLLTKGHIKLVFDNKKIIDISQGQIFGDWAIVNESVRLATATATVESEIIEIDAIAINSFKIDPKISYKIIRQIANTLVARLVIRSQIASHILINEGENQFTEFKSSLRWNSFKSDKDSLIEIASLKTIAGFLNAKGGVLFIGVRDDGSILGIEHDGFENCDKMMLHLTHLITNKLGKECLPDIHISIVSLEQKLILRIDCDASHIPIFLQDKKGELFFVRVGNMTQSFSMKEAFEYSKLRF